MKKRLLAALLVLFLLLPIFGQSNSPKTSIPGLSHFTLDNGLELFVLENHSTPLTYIEIAFRCGGYVQEKDTAGLFHLYEHMMFKGNSKFKTAADVTKAYLDLGVASWNGSTGAEYVNYYFTVPSANTKQGLEFWSYAVREARLDAKELENEKGVVTSEIQGSFATPAEIRSSAMDKYLFDKPWRRDAGGSIENIQNCTVEKLKAIKDKFYVPNNTALFVGGDVEAEAVFAMVNETYGSKVWKKAADPQAVAQEPQRFPAQNKPTYLVFPNKNFTSKYARVLVNYRGPDVVREPEPTYAADIWGFLIDNPSGPFKSNILAVESLSIPDPAYMAGYYYTQRDGGQVNFQAYMMANPKEPYAKRALEFSRLIKEVETESMIKNPAYFAEEEYALVKQILSDANDIQLETVDGFLGNLRFWWASASTDYYFNYVENMKKVGSADIAKYADKFIRNNNPIILVELAASVYEQQKQNFTDLGFTVINEDNAYWWKK